MDNGDSMFSIQKWLKTFNDPKIYISMPTLSKIRKRRMKNSNSMVPKTAVRATSKELDFKIKKLMETVRTCEKLEKNMSDNIKIETIKDWQYINQQKQDALKLISEIQGDKASGGDISLVLAKVFQKMETNIVKNEEEVVDSLLEGIGNGEREPIQDQIPRKPL